MLSISEKADQLISSWTGLKQSLSLSEKHYTGAKEFHEGNLTLEMVWYSTTLPALVKMFPTA
jgi:hypothetical protein